MTGREKVVHSLYFYYARRQNIAYSQNRPVSLVKPPAYPRRLDCSGLAMLVYYVNGMIGVLGHEGAKGYGNTWTLAQHGIRVARTKARPADLVFYDHIGDAGQVIDTLSHVAVLTDNGKHVVSNGHHPMGYYSINYAPSYLRINQVRSYLQ